MGMLERLLGRKPAAMGKARNSRLAPGSTQFAPSQLPAGAGPAHTARKDLLKLVLRETLTRNGIPPAWLGADLLRTTSAQREQGVHVRLLLRHWEPRLLEHGVAFERDFAHRLLLLDPTATEWLAGFSWQFALGDSDACPPLPHPGSWTAVSSAQEPAPADETRPGDIIAGPVRIPAPVDDVRADLERLLALRDEDAKRHAQGGDAFAATRPATL